MKTRMFLFFCVVMWLAVWQKIKAGKEVERWRPELEVMEHTHTHLTALFRDYPGESVPER